MYGTALGSAGGTSTFLHTDTIGAVTKARHVVGMPDAGAFRVIANECCQWVKTELHSTMISLYHCPYLSQADTVALHNSTGALSKTCTSAQSSPTEQWRCFTVPTLLPYIASPLFVLQSQFDHFQLQAMTGNAIKCMNAQSYFPPWKHSAATKCSQDDLNAMELYGAGWVKDFQPLMEKANVGLFLTGCIQHEERGTPGWTTLKAGGVVLRDAFYQWHQPYQYQYHPSKLKLELQQPRRHWINNCSLPCNTNPQVCAPLS